MKLFAALLAGTALIAGPAQAGLISGGDTNTYQGNNADGKNSTAVRGSGNVVGNTRNISGDVNRGALAGADVTNEGGAGGDGGDAKQGQAQGQQQGQQQGISGSGNSSSASGAVSGSKSSSSSRGGDAKSTARGGDQRQSQSSRSTSGVRNSGNSRNSNTNSSQSNNTNSTSSRSSADNNGNSQTLNYTNIDVPEATVAPTPGNGVPGQVGDVIVPLPSIVGGAFISEDDGVFGTNDRSTRGVTLGFQLPLGTGQVRRAAEQVIARRESAARFQLIQEATWMLQQGILREDVHPEHWAALYGAPSVAPIF